ncbi:MAG TPA: rhodanese-like domain-containing protein [Chthoniobacterales bacterium]|nr:rhodanese-like domain-containing protein [Chthoniobacterales bacterium]
MRISLGRQLLCLLGLAFVPAVGQALYYRQTAGWAEPPADSALVTVAQAEAWGDAVLWLDARPNEQFERAHVPGALQLNEDAWEEQLRTMLTAWSPDRKVVVYCSQKSCDASHEVAERLRKEAGLKNIYVLEGGWEEWQKQHH